MYNYNWNPNQQWSNQSGFGNQGQLNPNAFQQQHYGTQAVRPGVMNIPVPDQLQQTLQQSNPRLILNQQTMAQLVQQQQQSHFNQHLYLQQQGGQNLFLQNQSVQQNLPLENSMNPWIHLQHQQHPQQINPPLPPGPPPPDQPVNQDKPEESQDLLQHKKADADPSSSSAPQTNEKIPMSSEDLIAKTPGLEDTVNKLLPYINDIFSKVGASETLGVIPGFGDILPSAPSPKGSSETEVPLSHDCPSTSKTSSAHDALTSNVASADKEPCTSEDLQTLRSNRGASVSSIPDVKNYPSTTSGEMTDSFKMLTHSTTAADTKNADSLIDWKLPVSADITSEKPTNQSEKPAQVTPTVVPNSSSAAKGQTYDLQTLADFDKKFKDWEKQFDEWKLTNRNHKDQDAYTRYVDQWTHWRRQLLDQRQFILDQIEKQKAAKIAEEKEAEDDRLAQLAKQEIIEVQAAENRRLALLSAKTSAAVNGSAVNGPRIPSLMDVPVVPPNVSIKRASETKDVDFANSLAKTDHRDPFAPYQKEETCKTTTAENPFDKTGVSSRNPFDINPFEVANPFAMTTPTQSSNIFDQGPFSSNSGFTNFGRQTKRTQISDLGNSNQLANLQPSSRLARTEMTNQATQGDPQIPSLFKSTANNSNDVWSVGSQNYLSNDDFAPSVAKSTKRNDDSFDRSFKRSVNPFDLPSSGNSQGWNSSNPWTVEAQSQKNPFEVSALPTFAQFLKEQQKSGRPFDVSESFQTSRVQAAISSKLFIAESDNKSGQDFEKLFRRERTEIKGPLAAGDDYTGDDDFEEAVIDYGHGSSADVPDDDMLRYVRREEEPVATDDNYGLEDDDETLKDTVTIDYGHGSNPVDLDLYDAPVNIPPHPRDYYDQPFADGSNQDGFSDFQDKFSYDRPLDPDIGNFPRRMDGHDLVDMDHRFPTSRRPRVAPPPSPTSTVRAGQRDSDSMKSEWNTKSRDDGGVKIAPPRMDEGIRSGSNIRDRVRENEADKDRESDRYKGKDRRRDRERDSGRDRDRERERGRDRGRDRDKPSRFSRDSDNDKDRKRDSERDNGSRWSRNSNSRRRSRSPQLDNLVNPPPPVTQLLTSIVQPVAPPVESRSKTVLIDDLLSVTARKRRPAQIVIILRGLPGSGKSYLAKLIKDREVELGGSAPRVLSLDDYFMTEEEKIVTDPVTGKEIKDKVMQYVYEPLAEKSYCQDLIKTFKKTVENGYFPFIIIDSVNDQLKMFEEMITFGTAKRFQVYIAEMEDNVEECVKRNVHDRRREEIVNIKRHWQKLPSAYVKLDIRTLLQDEAVQDVEMEDVSPAEEDPVANADAKVKGVAAQEVEVIELEEEESAYKHVASKWEAIDHSEEKLNKLDGIRHKRKCSEEEVDQVSVESWLHRNLPDDYVERKGVHIGQKRVRWADIEERREQERMRDIGFVVGHTDWNRMTDPTFGSSALTKTKFI